MTKTILITEREMEWRLADWRMGSISYEAKMMINLVERGPLGSGGGSGETSSIHRDGTKMSTKLLSQGMSQTYGSRLDSCGSDVIFDRCLGKDSMLAGRRLNLKPYCGKTRCTEF